MDCASVDISMGDYKKFEGYSWSLTENLVPEELQ
jgi:hypothetical protein